MPSASKRPMQTKHRKPLQKVEVSSIRNTLLKMHQFGRRAVGSSSTLRPRLSLSATPHLLVRVRYMYRDLVLLTHEAMCNAEEFAELLLQECACRCLAKKTWAASEAPGPDIMSNTGPESQLRSMEFCGIMDRCMDMRTFCLGSHHRLSETAHRVLGSSPAKFMPAEASRPDCLAQDGPAQQRSSKISGPVCYSSDDVWLAHEE